MQIKLDIYSEYTNRGFIAAKIGEINPMFNAGSQFKISKTALPELVLVETKNVRPRRFSVSQMADSTVLTES